MKIAIVHLDRKVGEPQFDLVGLRSIFDTSTLREKINQSDFVVNRLFQVSIKSYRGFNWFAPK